MTLEAEALADRRRLQRRLSFWRFGGVIFAILIAGVLLLNSKLIPASWLQDDQIARVKIGGVILDDTKTHRLLKKLGKNHSVKAVLLHIDSPGGTTTGGEALYESIRDLRETKPVVAVFGTLATSAAYIAGIATDHIVARGNTITGSVGVIVQWAELSDLLAKLGIKMETVKSGRLKAVPSPFEPTSDEARELTLEMVRESQKWFNDLVAERRKVDPESLPGLTTGRIYSGRQALKLNLIDQIGGEDKAVSWLQTEKGIEKDLKIVDWRVENSGPIGFLTEFSDLSRWFIDKETEFLANFVKLKEKIDVLQLDGLISVWHPSAE